MIEVISHNTPEQVLIDQLGRFADNPAGEYTFAVEYRFQQYFLHNKPEIVLLAIFRLVDNGCGGVTIFAGVSDQVGRAKTLIKDGKSVGVLSEQLQFPMLNLSGPILLSPLSIAKPWGQEIWYTGIEERGQSSVTDGSFCTPLSWWLSVAGQHQAADKQQSINLLKILDPLPEAVYGDLYFELHEQKQEVYVVTHVDRDAWPDGVGGICFGFDQKIRAQHSDDESFRAAYLSAVQGYEAVRREIDSIFDRKREQKNIRLDAPLSAAQLKIWHAELPEELQRRELVQRHAMNRFMALKPLRVGDVVKVPCFRPHALQHGVRTVEFQTPVYERKILSFAQKVLTQPNWDTVESLNLMTLDEPKSNALEVVDATENHCLERVVSFDDFQVFRLTLKEGANWSVPATGEYALLMSVSGAVACGQQNLAVEQALFLPACRGDISVSTMALGDAVLLLAEPC